MSAQNGGPAFPLPTDEDETAQLGMTLRDYFAAHAIVMFSSSETIAAVAAEAKRRNIAVVETGIARACYDLADAMLAERAKESK